MMNDTTDTEAPVLRGLPSHLTVTGLVGSGAQKSVYRAFDRNRGEEIAVICLERRANPRGDVARVEELQAFARIQSHPHVLDLLEVIELDERLIVCVPYMSRGDLSRRIADVDRSPIPIREALRIGVQLADAIGHVHRHGFIHGDIKAENVLLADDGTIRLDDFGLVHLGTVPATAKLSGTLTYVAPERIRGEQADARSDLYSFGCLLYELFSGRAPLSGSTPAELLNLHLMARPRELQSRRREVPSGVSQLVDRMLEKQPGSRPQSALEVHGALSAALRAEAFPAIDAARSVDLPSRMDGEARLDRIVRGAREGRAAIVLVTGELGSGKSEALRRLGRRALESGFGVSVGIAHAESAVPYSPMIEALTGVAGELTDLETGQADRLLDFLYLKGPQRPREGADHGVTQDRLFASVLAALNAASQRRPLLLILEDLDNADEATLELLTYLEYAISARGPMRGLDLLIAASCRADAIPKGVDEMIRRGGVDSVVDYIELEPLEGRDLVRLVETHGLASPERTVLDAIATASAGNVLSVVEIVRLIRLQGPTPDETTPRSLSEWLERSPLPLDTHGLVARKLAGRSPQCRHALELAAILGIDFEAPLVERLGRALDIDVGSWLEEALELGILVDRGERLSFSHPLFREELNRSVPGERRTWVHLKRVQILQDDVALSEERRDLEIAHHLIAAGEASDAQELVEYATRAGTHALARFAWSEAARFFDGAIGRLEKDGPSMKLASLHHQSGVAFFRVLDASPCLRHFARAVSLYAELGDDMMRSRVSVDRARAVNWMGMMGTPEFDQSRLELEQCLDRTSVSHRLLRAEILSVLAEQTWATNDPVFAEALCLEALEETRPEVDHLLRAEISVTLGLAQLSRLNQRAALATWRFGALHSRWANELSSTARCLQRMRMALFVSGRIDEARALTSEVSALNRIVQLPSEAALTHAITAAIAVLAGDFEGAEKEMVRGIDQLSRARYPWALALMIPTRACARALAGDLDGAMSALEELADSPIHAVNERDLETFTERHRSLVNYFVGDPVRLSPERRAELIAELQNLEHDEAGLYQACLALELASALQDAELARLALPIADEAVKRGWIVTTGWPFFLPRLVGAARLILGDVAGAVERLEAALPAASSDAFPIEWGRVRFDLARALVLSLEESVLPRAVILAREAREALGRFPRNDFLERAEGLVRYLEERF